MQLVLLDERVLAEAVADAPQYAWCEVVFGGDVAGVFVPVAVLGLHGEARQSQGLLLTAVGPLLQHVMA